MASFYTLKGIVTVMVGLLEMSIGTTAAWSSAYQPIWQRSPTIGQTLRYSYPSYQPSQSYARPVYTPVQGNQYPTYNPAYRQTQAGFFPQTLQYQGYRIAPAPTPVVPAALSISCPSCPAPTPAPVCPAISCPAQAPAPSCPAPTPVPVCPVLSCPAPVPVPLCPEPAPEIICPVLSCPPPDPVPVCPAPPPEVVCPEPVPPPECPAPVDPIVCPAPEPAPVCPAVAPAPPAVPVLSDTEKGILDFANWQCMKVNDASNVAISSCTVIGTGAGLTTPPERCLHWVLPVFCDSAVNDVAKAMSAKIVPPPAAPIPAGYTLVDNQGYFKVNTQFLTFDQAATACAADGAILAVPQSPEDYPPLLQMALNALPFHTSGFFIGFTDKRVQLDWEYPTGQRACTTGLFKHQTIYEGLAGEFCSTIGFIRQPDLQDVPCTWVIPSLCQIPLPSRYPPAPCA